MNPTATSMKLKFPAFADVDPATIEFAIEEAVLVNGQYTKRCRDIAVMYLAAHLLAMEQVSADSQGRFVSHESIGRLSTSYREAGKDVAFGEYASTWYGKRYLQLLRLGEPAFKTIGGRAHRQGILSGRGFWW